MVKGAAGRSAVIVGVGAPSGDGVVRGDTDHRDRSVTWTTRR
ncbi:hypothetical protein Ae406Ps2_4735 [Pseudonocardia sp. Ae406_Ps2]|nr:hypothetical protein Ae331Ps2_1221c [Pseudonocardia sp. Ae331_Ps2]OLM04735.1 hypothetical protein Ae406Ps2_4735 [Pseudonocardia sp. Ae406_Ps2]OLM10441.1 hypothetical protein Ae505Ps2_0564c [Pseudonocardia sp. Ae505_Ps2]OLM26302.1 hypothetical protein Ae706Ps2_4735 [Pseudonocardia sp. Ae706_Ps2]